MVTLFFAALDQTIVVTALPRIVADVGGLTSYSWIVTAYMLALTVTVPRVRQARRRLRRAPARSSARSRSSSSAPALCGARPDDAAARRLPRAPGHRRRRARPDRALDRRRSRPAPRARPLPGADRRDLRGRGDRRAAARRRDRRQRELALDLLRQPAARRARVRGDRADDAAARRPGGSARSTGSAPRCSRPGPPRCCSRSSGAATSTRGARRRWSAPSPAPAVLLAAFAWIERRVPRDDPPVRDPAQAGRRRSARSRSA